MSPTSRYVRLDTKLSYTQWSVLNITIKEKLKELKKLRRNQFEMCLWLMEQVEYLKELKKNNVPYMLGTLLNGKPEDSLINFKK